jgi:hypothetical protein
LPDLKAPFFQTVAMKIKGFVFTVPKLRVEGIALFPFILTKRKAPGHVLLNHERIHLKQQLELGIVFFYLWYLIEYFIRLIQYKQHYLAYLHISFEREAYHWEAQMDYLKNRPFWAFRKYI